MKWFWLCSYLLLCTALPVRAVELRYDVSGSSGWYPYYNEDAEKPGVVVELIPLILQRAGIQGAPLFMPPKRTIQALESGLIDFDVISPDWFPQQQISGDYVLSNPIFPITEHLVYLPKQQGKWTEPNSIAGHWVGTVRGYFYHDEDAFKRYDFSSERELVKALRLGRVNVAIIGDLPARYWSAMLKIPVVIGPVHSDGALHIRLRQRHRHLLPAINQAIAQLREEGMINSIEQKYVSPHAYQPASEPVESSDKPVSEKQPAPAVEH